MTDDAVNSVDSRRRRYDNSGRAARAAANRAAVLDAGRDVLVEKGYTGTTMAGIARAAGVSVETLYKGFGTKRELVWQILGTAVVGDDEPVALMQRPDMRAALEAGSGAAVLGAFADGSLAILQRIGPLAGILLASGRSGDADLREIADEANRRRLADMVTVAEAVAATGDLHPDVDVARAADTLWSVGSPEVYVQLTEDRGWSADEYRAWLVRSFQALLLR
jgi:AcrR family transcriptional regulator